MLFLSSSFAFSHDYFRSYAVIGLYLFITAAISASSVGTAEVCEDVMFAIQQKVDNVILLPKAIEPYPSVHSKPLNHL